MKKLILMVLMAFCCVVHAVGLVEALEGVESNGNAFAIGDNGKAKGILQIHAEVVADVNRIYKTSYVHDDAFNKAKAEQICRMYLRHYGMAYEKRTGKQINVEILARLWNGGPAGYRNRKTDGYWAKVRRNLGVEVVSR